METRRTRTFITWFEGLREIKAQAAIARRIVRVEAGLMGDVKFFGGIGELRIDFGPGYRVYFVRREAELILLLAGGTKRTQGRDIAKAQELAAMLP